MATVAFDADEAVIEAARTRARREQTSLDAELARWLKEYSLAQVAEETAPRKDAESAPRSLEELDAALDRFQLGQASFPSFTLAERRALADRSLATLRELRKTIKTGGRKFTRAEMNER